MVRKLFLFMLICLCKTKGTMWRVFKNRKDFFLSNSKGYTLTEMIVVMGVLTMLLTITFNSYGVIRRQKYIQHVANLAQTNIRDTFIDTISTKVENTPGCLDLVGAPKAPQIKVLRIELSSNVANPISRVAVCNNNSSPPALSSPDTLPVDASSSINYRQNIRTSFNTPWGDYPTDVSSGFLYIIFTSPYGKYYSYYTTETDSDLANTNFENIGWQKNAETDIYEPSSPQNLGYIIVNFNSNTGGGTGVEHQIWITSEGNVELQ